MSGKDPEMAEDTQRQLLKRGHRHPKCVSIAVRHNSKVPVLYVPPAKTALAIARGLLFFEIMDRKVSR